MVKAARAEESNPAESPGDPGRRTSRRATPERRGDAVLAKVMHFANGVAMSDEIDIKTTARRNRLQGIRYAIQARWPDAIVSVISADYCDCDAAGFGTPHDRAEVEAEALAIAQAANCDGTTR